MYLIWFTGDVEIITLGPNDRVVLEPHMTSIVLSLLELVYTEGDTTAIVRTIKPLDYEEIRPVCSTLTDPKD